MYAANTVIENLLQRKKAQAAMVLDALFVTDAIKLESIEISSILHYFRLSGIKMSESILRKGLFDLAQFGLLRTFKIMTRSKGRPFWNYTPKSLHKMAEILGVKLHRDEHADPVPFGAFISTKAYRAAKHFGLLARLGRSWLSRKKLGARLGVQGRSTYNYEIDTKIKVEPRFDRTSMKTADIAAAPINRPNANIFLEVRIERDMTDEEMRTLYSDFDETYLLIGNRKTADYVKMPYTKFILERELGRGHEVTLCKQITNEYTISA